MEEFLAFSQENPLTVVFIVAVTAFTLAWIFILVPMNIAKAKRRAKEAVGSWLCVENSIRENFSYLSLSQGGSSETLDLRLPKAHSSTEDVRRLHKGEIVVMALSDTPNYSNYELDLAWLTFTVRSDEE